MVVVSVIMELMMRCHRVGRGDMGALSCRLGFFAQLPLGLNALLLLKRRKGFVASLSLKPRRLFFGQVLNNTSFLLPEQKKRNKENSPSALFGLLRHFSPLNKKNSLTLKQLFVFHAPKSTSASRPKSEAGPFCFFCATSLRSLGGGVFFLRFALLFTIFFISFRPPWKSVKKFLHFSVKNKKLFER